MVKKSDFFSEATRKNVFRVTIFGSARVKKTDKIYKDVFQLGKMLGKNGIDLVTGGGPGLMDAASHGHEIGRKKTNAHTIGLNIKLPHEQIINNHVTLKKEFARFSKRLDNFMLLSDAIVVAPGGVGTLLELMYAWQLMQVEHIDSIPIILMGDMWKGLTNWLKKHPMRKKYFEKKDLDFIFYVNGAKEAMEIIEIAHKAHLDKNRTFSPTDVRYGIK